MPDEPAIRAQKLSRRFREVTAVDEVDLAIARGEIYGFLGPNGAGKSTTVRMFCTLLSPTGGSATVAGFDIAHRPNEVRLRIGAALQDAALDLKQTGREILVRQARLYGLRSREIRIRMADVQGLIDIGDAIDRQVGTYSGGMRRRLNLAAALMHNPDILFLDEPTTGLDPVSRARVWQEVRRLNSELGMTIFLTTQYLEEADALADRVGIIDDGRLVAEGEPESLKREIGQDVVVVEIMGDSHAALAVVQSVSGVSDARAYDTQVVARVGGSGSASIGPIAVALDRAGLAVANLSLRRPTLDDVFLEATGARLQSEQAGEPV
ncbi:MAG: ATP-binding cassette domain-containing protein [Thermoleophilia bacterium]|nr:ATP-binding cassette domain-containing protein [Thermoleophilia bacterium]MDH3725472.1 ATP-binding cassette domain-containing protein [Thermoleophilia bacterium]